jgi:hypothetical protein
MAICGRNYNPYDCIAAFDYCQTELQLPFMATGKVNIPRSIRISKISRQKLVWYLRALYCQWRIWYALLSSTHTGRYTEPICFQFVYRSLRHSQIAEYLSKNETKDLLGVPRSHHFEAISMSVNTAFTITGDVFENSEAYLVGLLERGRLIAHAQTPASPPVANYLQPSRGPRTCLCRNKWPYL